MGALAFAILIGLLVFSAVLAIYFALRNQRRQKHSAAVVHRSFERASDRPAEGSGPVRRTGDMNQRKRGEGRGRFYTFGILIGAVMGTLAVKLWTLQVLASDQYVLAATENMTSSVSLPAIRGRILDRNGNELVGNRPTLVVLGKKSVADNRSVVHRLSLILGVPRSIVRRNLLDDTQGVQADRMVAQDVSMRAVAFIKEHPTLFDDVSVESRTVRSYPYGTLAAQVLGYVGPASEADLASTGEDNPIESGDIVGKDGAEYSFERLLRGIHGTRTFKVDADGNPAEIVGEVGGTSGDDVCLTLDLELQQATDKILADIISSSHLKG
ncbi:MAG: hypothetical protein LBS58_02210, partial [Coriobacteriales bacterium]|nr:hypothetical protein [Coriobacteriales bacterium]